MSTLLLSNSTSPGRPYLAHARDWIADALAGATRVAFVPYAAVTFSDDAYLDRVREALDGLGLEVVGVHASADPAGVVGAADAVMVGGGNTFHLLRAMYRHGLVEAIRQRAAEGAPYVGWSAGANVAGPTIRTTNDMPIVEPPTLDALGLDRLPTAEAPLDLAFDGADEVDPDAALIKGRGAAHVREKVIASLAARFVVLVDGSKLVDRLGTTAPVPVEVLPFAEPAVTRALRGLGAEPELRMGERKDGPVVSDQGLWVLDARFDGIDDPAGLGVAIDTIPGVLGHGVFVGLATDVLVGEADGQVRHRVHAR